MPIVSSFGALKSMTDRSPSWVETGSNSSVSLGLYGRSRDYFEIYKTQPNVRICVEFLARNIAQLGLHTFRRISDTDRERLNDHDLAKWLTRPNPATTRYRLIEDLMTDLGIYYRAYWLKVRYPGGDGRNAIGLVRLPPEEVAVEGGLIPTAFHWIAREDPFSPSEIVHFAGYRLGISPLETLRRILAEEEAAGEYRESLWSHGAKHEGIWERDSASPNYTPTQIAAWREQWQEFATTSKAGMTAVGERGWTYKASSFSSRESEYVAGGKLRREICAAAYHIPQPMVGILDHATFSNIKEQHKHTYQDTLGPWNEMIVQEIERQLLTECEDQDRVYLEFNIAAKLAGSFEEQAGSISTLTGRPVMTANEGRALLNLPKDTDPDSDKIAAQQGGPAASSDKPSTDFDDTDDGENAAVAHALESARARHTARLQKLDVAERPAALVAAKSRWHREVLADLMPLVGDEKAWSSAQAGYRQLLNKVKAEAEADA